MKDIQRRILFLLDAIGMTLPKNAAAWAELIRSALSGDRKAEVRVEIWGRDGCAGIPDATMPLWYLAGAFAAHSREWAMYKLDCAEAAILGARNGAMQRPPRMRDAFGWPVARHEWHDAAAPCG